MTVCSIFVVQRENSRDPQCTNNDAFFWEVSSPLLSSSGCQDLALWRRQSGQEAFMGLRGLTAIGSWPSSIALDLAAHFHPPSLLGQRVLDVGWKQTLGASVAYWLHCPEASMSHTQSCHTRVIVHILITWVCPACPTTDTSYHYWNAKSLALI